MIKGQARGQRGRAMWSRWIILCDARSGGEKKRELDENGVHSMVKSTERQGVAFPAESVAWTSSR